MGASAERYWRGVSARYPPRRHSRDGRPRAPSDICPDGIARANHATFWLVDSAAADSNAYAGYVLKEAATAVERFRAERKKVLLHCVRAESRTPRVAALYGARVAGVTPLEALERVRSVLPNAHPNPAFRDVLVAKSLGTTLGAS